MSSSEKQMISFAILSPMAIGRVSEAGQTVAVTVPAGTAKTALVACFTVSPGAIVRIGSNTQSSGVTENDFSSAVTYVVVAEDGSTRNYVVTVSTAASSDSIFATTMDCIASMIACLSGSSSLQTAVAAVFPGRVLSFWQGYDSDTLPLAAKAPGLILVPAEFGRDSDRTQTQHSIQVCLFIEGRETRSVGKATIHPGYADAEILAKAIDNSLSDWIDDNFNGIHKKAYFQTSMKMDVVKTVWQYTFSDQI